MPNEEFYQAVDRMPRENRFRATVYAMNSLLIASGAYTADQFEDKFLEWDAKERGIGTSQAGPTKLGVDAILAAVGRHFGLSTGSITAKSNYASVVLPRSVAMFLMRELKNFSYPEIGRYFNKHHTTVIHSMETLAKRRESDLKLNELINDLIAELN